LIALVAAFAGGADSFVMPPAAAALYGGGTRLRPAESARALRRREGVRASAQDDKEQRRADVSRRSAIALLGLLPYASASAAPAPEEVNPKNDPYYQKLRDSQDPSAERKRLQKGMASPGSTRKTIEVPKALLKKGALQPPDIEFPKSAADLEEYTLTESGLYFQPVKTGKGAGQLPKKGEVIEIHYIGAVATVDEEGTYDVAEREGNPEIYPNLPQGIIRDSPRFDSSYDRGRTMKVRFGRAQLAGGLEEALADMHPGDAKMVLLTPDLAYACPAGKVCFPDIEADERLVFYVEVVSTGGKGDVGG